MGSSPSSTKSSDGSTGASAAPLAPSVPVVSDGQSCGRIPVGGYAKMEGLLNYFDDPAQGEYLLMRKPPVNGVDQYDIVLNYQWNPVDPQMNDRFMACMNDYNPYLRGPNGEQMTIRLPLPSDPILPKGHTVAVSLAFQGGGVAGGGGGENALQWNPYMDCSTILHETMHHLGLVDEYPDSTTCRSLGPSDSLMTRPMSAASGVLPIYRAHVYKCTFSGDQQTQCLHALDLIEGGMKFTSTTGVNSNYLVHLDNGEDAMLNRDNFIPLNVSYHGEVSGTDGTILNNDGDDLQEHTLWGDRLFPPQSVGFNVDGNVTPDRTMGSLLKLAQQYAKPTRVSSTKIIWVEATPRARQSILYPAEASTVLYGRCEANSTFIACEHDAYGSSFCSSKPASCPSLKKSQAPTDAWVKLPDGVNP